MTIWPAPAKLNLFLLVVGRRDNGYHELQTVFQFLDYADSLSFRVTREPDIVQSTPLAGVEPGRDLCVRAARLLQLACGVSRGVVITIVKRIPIGTGLGGGSSDAATTLLALNRLWEVGLETAELAELGLGLGADVPVFVRGHAAWAEGVGEILAPIELDEPWYVVLVPPVSVSTAEIFAEFADSGKTAQKRDGAQLTHYSPAITIRDFHAGRSTHHDLEAVVRRRHPEVDAALRWLAGFGATRMTGSGGAVFIQVENAEHGREILRQAPAACTGFVARGMNRHPLN